MSVEINNTQVAQMKDVISKVVAIGPDFLDKKITADKMAHTMIDTVQEYAKRAEKEGTLKPKSNEAEELMSVLQELLGCGSGYLEQRCDAACVARTMTSMVNEFAK